MCKCYYGDDDDSVLLCNIVNFKVFENVMSLDIVMGGLINIILYLLVVVMEGEVLFIMVDIDRLFCKVFYLCKVVFLIFKYYMEDVYWVGGVLGILNELNKVGLLNIDVNYVLGKLFIDVISEWDIINFENEDVIIFYCVGFVGICMIKVFS